MQFDLFPATEPVLIKVPCDPDGHVCKDAEILETIHLRDNKVEIWIELARDGERWMFSASVQTNISYSGYRVGKKWGKFAHSRADAIHFAAEEIKARSAGKECEQQIAKLITQLLTPEVRFVA